MTVLITALIVILGVGGVAITADNARPGDALFGIDQVAEKIQLSVTSKEKKNSLRIKIAGERLDEVSDLINETEGKVVVTVSGDATSDTDDSDTDDNEESDDSDKADKQNKLPQDERENVGKGIELAASILAEIANDVENENAKLKLQAVIDKFNVWLESASVEVEVEGEFEIEDKKDENNDDDSEDSKGNGESDDKEDKESDKSDKVKTNTEDSNEALEIEADLFTDITIIKVEKNGEKTVFSTKSKTIASIEADILAKFDTLSATEISSALEIEIENRASQPDDLD